MVSIKVMLMVCVHLYHLLLVMLKVLMSFVKYKMTNL